MSEKKQNKYTVEFKKQSSICIIQEEPMIMPVCLFNSQIFEN